jgi:hypothetical protein
MGTQELLWKLRIDTTDSEAQLKKSRQSIETYVAVVKSQFGSVDKALSSASAQISKMNLSNLTADYSKFSNALTNNSRNVRKSADDFLNLFDKVNGGTGYMTAAVREASRLGETFKVLSSAAVIADGPLGGIASRIRAMGTEANEANHIFGSTAGILVGTGLAAGAAAFGLFELIKKSAELGKSILETAEKSNFTTEAISGMRIPAEQTGLGLERLGAKLAGFNSSLGNAQLGQKAFIQAFKDMGVDIKQGVEPAFDQFLTKFKEMGPTSQRNALEAKIFKDRTGEMIPFLEKATVGLDAMKQRAQELGLSFSEDSARASRDFADRITLMKLGLEGFVNRVGQQLTPQVIASLNDIGHTLGQNQNSWSSWADFVSTQINRILIGARTLAQDVGRALDTMRTMGGFGGSVARAALGVGSGYVPASDAWQSVVKSFHSNADWLGARDAAREDPSLIWQPWKRPGSETAGAGEPRIHSGGGKAKKDTTAKDAFEAELVALKQAITDRESQYREETDRLKHEYNERLISFNEHIAAERAANDSRFNDVIDKINEEQTALDAALAHKVIKQAEYDKKNAELTSQTTKATAELHKEEGRLAEESYKRRLELAKEFRAAVEAAADDSAMRDKEQLRRLLDAKALDEIQYQRAVVAVNLSTNARKRRILDDEIKDLTQHIADVKKIRFEEAAVSETVLDALAAQKGKREAIEREGVKIVEDGTYAISISLQQRAALYVKLDTEAANSLRLRALQERRYELERLASTIGLNAKLIEELRKLAREEQQERHNRLMDEIAAREAEARAIDTGGEHKLEIEKRYNALRKQENDRFNNEKKQSDADTARDTALQGGAGGFLSGLQTGQLAKLEAGVQSFADVSKVAFSAVGVAVNGLAKGIGNLVQNWVLMGSQADISMKKLVATVLAGVAAQAATLAVFETALGIAALTPFGAIIYGTAAQHFAAAALFASIATAAAVVGRLAAGNDFQSTNKGTASQTSASNTGSQQQATPIREEWQQPARSPIVDIARRNAGGVDSAAVLSAIKEGLEGLVIRAKITRDPGSVAEMWIEEYNLNGRLRKTVLEDG